MISFETAKLAKLKGYNESTRSAYQQNGLQAWRDPAAFDGLGSPQGYTFWNWEKNPKLEEIYFAAPTQSDLHKWLREEKGVSVDVYTSLKNKTAFKFGCDMVAFFDISDEWQSYNMNVFFNTYEEALEAGLKKALELIQPCETP